ncbi:MAG: alpha/beta fold hydrolase [Actinobacteria bacterium]|nr:alpha/beta fold hydrolase [Actinomycetota bacterium]MCA1721978.1 alpha/beta fold hydrolase [Actinomycetota bacterium]
MPAEPNGRLVPAHDTHLYVVERGPGDALPVLVLHGGPGLDHTVFGSWLDPLTDRYRLVLIDGRNQGRSDRDTDPATWTLSQHASDVSAVAAAIGAERYAVLGHSFGAFVALQHAADAPGAAVATIASSGVPSDSFLEAVEKNFASFEPEELREQVTSSWEREASVQTEEECRQLLADQMPFHFADPRDPRIAELEAETVHMRYSPEVLRGTSLEGGGLSIDVEGQLSHVPQPVLALAGRHDRTCVPEASARIAELAPKGELHVIESAGHMTYVEAPEEFVRVVRDFLDRATS